MCTFRIYVKRTVYKEQSDIKNPVYAQPMINSHKYIKYMLIQMNEDNKYNDIYEYVQKSQWMSHYNSWLVTTADPYHP